MVAHFLERDRLALDETASHRNGCKVVNVWPPIIDTAVHITDNRAVAVQYQSGGVRHDQLNGDDDSR